MTDLSALLSRIKAASGKDRELDAYVWAFANGHELRWEGNTEEEGD